MKKDTLSLNRSSNHRINMDIKQLVLQSQTLTNFLIPEDRYFHSQRNSVGQSSQSSQMMDTIQSSVTIPVYIANKPKIIPISRLKKNDFELPQTVWSQHRKTQKMQNLTLFPPKQIVTIDGINRNILQIQRKAFQLKKPVQIERPKPFHCKRQSLFTPRVGISVKDYNAKLSHLDLKLPECVIGSSPKPTQLKLIRLVPDHNPTITQMKKTRVIIPQTQRDDQNVESALLRSTVYSQKHR